MTFVRGNPRPAGSGRKAGTPNQVSAEIRALAQEHGPQAIETLAHLMEHGDTAATRVLAANALLDRGFGKPKQMTEVSGPEEGPIPIETTSITDEQRLAAIMTLLAKGH